MMVLHISHWPEGDCLWAAVPGRKRLNLAPSRSSNGNWSTICFCICLKTNTLCISSYFWNNVYPGYGSFSAWSACVQRSWMHHRLMIIMHPYVNWFLYWFIAVCVNQNSAHSSTLQVWLIHVKRFRCKVALVNLQTLKSSILSFWQCVIKHCPIKHG